MYKVIVNYDPVSGAIVDDLGVTIYSYMGLAAKTYDENERKSDIDSLRNLKESGFTVEEIIQLKREGLVQ